MQTVELRVFSSPRGFNVKKKIPMIVSEWTLYESNNIVDNNRDRLFENSGVIYRGY